MQTVSIVVPVYNAEKYLPVCLRSILRQSYRQLEVILVNDGSNDGSLAICKKFAAKDDRVRVIDIPNGGVSNARNTGLAAATGAYVQFVDSDDILHRHMVRRMVTELERTGVGLAVCDMQQVLVRGLYSRTVRTMHGKLPPELHSMDEDTFLQRLPWLLHEVGGMESPCNKLYRLSLLCEHGIKFPADMRYGEDLMFNIGYFAVCGGVVFLDQPLYRYMHWGELSLTRRCPPDMYAQLMCQMDALQQMLQQKTTLSVDAEGLLAKHRAAYLYEFISMTCEESATESDDDKVASLQKALDDPAFLSSYFAAPPQNGFAPQIESLVRARDARGVFQTFQYIRAQLKEEAKRPVSAFLARRLRSFSEKYPESRLGKAARILYLNLATVGMGETIKRILRRFAR